MNKSELTFIAKQCLSIVNTATVKDKEIGMLIDSAISDLKSVDIDVDKNIDDAIIQSAIMLYVKGHFGNTDIREKELSNKSYDIHKTNLSLNHDYRVVDSDV